MRYVDLVIDNKSEKTDQFYTYGCEDDSIRPGSKVYVTFGRGSALREAYVFGVRDSLDSPVKNLKYVEKTDTEVSLTEEMVSTCVWMRRRYLCKYIDAVRCFIPVGRKSARGKERIPFADAEGEIQDIEKLTDEQEQALEKISGAIEDRRNGMFLLRGVTGSGKTEVYMQAIAKALDKGRSAIMLVPEISLTKQIIDRFIGRFGAENVAVLHSRLSDGERHDEWMRIRDGRVRIVIGARSAVFAPLDDIGVIVMDEEHETTYKSDMSPKYETSEVAIKRLKEHSGVFIMGSATPSVVSWSRAGEGIYEKLELTERYNKVRLPEVEVVDMREELKTGNTGQTGDTFPQQERILQFRFLQRMRRSDKVPGLRHFHDIPQRRKKTYMPLLRKNGQSSGQMSVLRQQIHKVFRQRYGAGGRGGEQTVQRIQHRAS